MKIFLSIMNKSYTSLEVIGVSEEKLAIKWHNCVFEI